MELTPLHFKNMSSEQLSGYPDLLLYPYGVLLGVLDPDKYKRLGEIVSKANEILAMAGNRKRIHYSPTQLNRLLDEQFVERRPENKRNWTYRRTESGLYVLLANREKYRRGLELITDAS